MEKIELEGLEGPIDEMAALLGNKMARCPKFGDNFRPLYACYKHSHGDFGIPGLDEALAECVGCTRWLRAVEGYDPEEGGTDNKGKETKWSKIEL